MADIGDFFTTGEKFILLCIVVVVVVMSSWDTIKEKGICRNHYDNNVQFCEDFCGSNAIHPGRFNSTAFSTKGLFSCELEQCTCEYCLEFEFGVGLMVADCVPIKFEVSEI